MTESPYGKYVEGKDTVKCLEETPRLIEAAVRALCRTLTPEQRARPLTHPDYGLIDVQWVMTMIAGHERHHLPQFVAIATPGAARERV